MVARGLEAALAEEPDLEVVGIAGTVEDGVLRFRQLRPDVVVMDYRLPDGEGTDATRQIRATEAEAAVLLLTGADDPSVVAAALDSGCSGFVSKDRDVDELASAIRAVARGAAVFPADLLSRALSPAPSKSGLGSDLTSREREVLAMLADGASTEEIGSGLFLSLHTVRNHVRNILTKLHSRTKLEAVVVAARVRSGRPASRRVRSLRAPRRGRRRRGVHPGVRRPLRHLARRPRRSARRHAPKRRARSPTNVAEQYEDLLGDTRTLLRAIGSVPPNDIVLGRCQGCPRRDDPPDPDLRQPLRRRRRRRRDLQRPTDHAADRPAIRVVPHRTRATASSSGSSRKADRTPTRSTAIALGFDEGRGPFVAAAEIALEGLGPVVADVESSSETSVTVLDESDVILFNRPGSELVGDVGRRPSTGPCLARRTEWHGCHRRWPRRRRTHLHAPTSSATRKARWCSPGSRPTSRSQSRIAALRSRRPDARVRDASSPLRSRCCSRIFR